MAMDDDIIAQLEAEQAQQEADAQAQQAYTRQQISQGQNQQVGLGQGLQNGMSSFRTGQGLASMFSSSPVASVSPSFVSGGTATGSTAGMTGTWGSVAGGGSSAGAGASSAGASSSGGLAAAGPWAALAAAVIGHNEWAERKGLRDGESFKGEYGLTGRALYKDKDWYAERADKIVPGLGSDINLGASFSSPADLFRGDTWKGAAKSALKGGVIGGLLKKIF